MGQGCINWGLLSVQKHISHYCDCARSRSVTSPDQQAFRFSVSLIATYCISPQHICVGMAITRLECQHCMLNMVTCSNEPYLQLVMLIMEFI